MRSYLTVRLLEDVSYPPAHDGAPEEPPLEYTTRAQQQQQQQEEAGTERVWESQRLSAVRRCLAAASRVDRLLRVLDRLVPRPHRTHLGRAEEAVEIADWQQGTTEMVVGRFATR